MENKTDSWGEDWIKEVLGKGKEQIKKELRDYWEMMQVYSKVLDRVTNGKMSKTNYTLEAIESVLDEIDLVNVQEKNNG